MCVVKLAGATGILVQDVVDILWCLFEHAPEDIAIRRPHVLKPTKNPS